jgi:hypothetical protein
MVHLDWLRKRSVQATLLLSSLVCPNSLSADPPESGLSEGRDVHARDWQWTASPPLISPRDLPGISCYSIKDPSIVRFDDQWHLFCTVRGEERSHAVVYLPFADWDEADAAPRHVLPMHEGFFCAPQVFYYAPHEKWYLVCQASDPSWSPEYQAAFSTSCDLSNPESWTRLAPLGLPRAKDDNAGLDFWIICDEAKAHLFFSTLDGRMWRSETSRTSFPHGWSEPAVAIEGDIFEASHTYELAGSGKYLTIIEAQDGHGWRYYKAYLADRLEGPWEPLAATKEDAFASMKNVAQPAGQWTDSISHGELLRTNHNETPTVDPANLQFLFQGVLEQDRAGKPYGEIPWKLGLLKFPVAVGPKSGADASDGS